MKTKHVRSAFFNGSEVNRDYYKSRDTIVAQATPKGVGAISIVRLSGRNAVNIAAGICKNKRAVDAAEPKRLLFVELQKSDGTLLDNALCVIYRSPKSYTGEDSVEFFLHGSPHIVSLTIERCCQNGARTAEPGEFTKRAFLNGRIDLAQAEGIADLIASTGELSHRAAILQREGALSKRIEKIRNRLTEMCGLIELEIDFIEQNLPVIDREEVQASLNTIKDDLTMLEHSIIRGRLAREGATVVIAGAPNVGKSTLFNMLTGEERAIVHETPGTTRDAVEAIIDWDGLTIRLIDTAGQSADFSGPDVTAVEKARHAVKSSDIVLWVIDLHEAHSQLPSEDIAGKSLIIGNKADLLGDGEEQLKNDCITVSALKVIGLEKIKSAVLERLLPEGTENITDGVITRDRHLDCVRIGREAIDRSLGVIDRGEGEELIAADLREAVDALGEIIGEVTNEDVIRRIFSDFCIGK